MVYTFFYNHNVYKHTHPQIKGKIKHIFNILPNYFFCQNVLQSKNHCAILYLINLWLAYFEPWF